MKARIHVTFETGVLDPQGKATASRPRQLGFHGIARSAGKTRHRGRARRDRQARGPGDVEQMCRKLLANTVIENYAIEL